MIRDEGGSAAITTVILLPVLLTMVVGVLQLGAIRVLAARVASAADLATLAAADDQDGPELVRTGAFRLSGDAEAVARSYFALNLSQIEAWLAVTPGEAAADADVVAFASAPATDPLTGWRYDRPTVRLAARVPIRTPLFGSLLAPTTMVNVRAASAAR